MLYFLSQKWYNKNDLLSRGTERGVLLWDTGFIRMITPAAVAGTAPIGKNALAVLLLLPFFAPAPTFA
jgi:hypothetical protein